MGGKTIIKNFCVVLFFVVFMIAGIVICENKLPSEPLNEDEIKTLISKYTKFDNIKIETIENGNGTEEMKIITNIKDGKTKITTKGKDSEMIEWSDSESGENIMIDVENKTWYDIAKGGNEDIGQDSYQFIGYEKYNNSKCAIIEQINEISYEGKDAGQLLKTTAKMWVDLKTGVALKTEYSNNLDLKYQAYSVVTFNKVTDEDVMKPDLNGYTQRY